MHGSPPPVGRSPSSRGSGLRVLLVDDDPEERRLIREILRSRGHTVTVCADAESAWDAHQTEPFPLILLERFLPRMDGVELCRRIRGSPPAGDHCVIVVVTPSNEPHDLEEILDAGADDYIGRPVDEALLDARLAVAERRTREEMRAREEESRKLAEQLRQANQELETFAYSVSHDLRAPLRTMQGFAHALLEDHGAELPAEARDHARRIIRSSEHCERLISDLLTYSRLGFEDVRLEPVDLRAVAEAALEQLEADLTGAEALVDLPEVFPRVLGSRVTLTQVMANLLSNAVKFVPDGTRPEIRIRVEGEGRTTRLWVEDNGVGIPIDDQERIFRPFERLGRGQDRPGAGIGLAIVRRGMERIGGSAGVESEPGGGARFWIEIPVRPGAPS